MSQSASEINCRFLCQPFKTQRLGHVGHNDNNNGFTLDIDISLPGTGLTAIYGPSGCGKTTLLRCIAGLESPQIGRLSVQNQVWQDESSVLPAHKRPVGYVFQESSLFPHLSARGNLDYALKRAHQPMSANQFEHLLSVLGIKHLLEQSPEQLSGGEKQRVAIARALCISPQILLMDEPLASLDDGKKQEILPYLEAIRDEVNIPVIYVSHAVNEITRLADFAITMSEGQVLASGPVTELFSQPDLPGLSQQEVGVTIDGAIAAIDESWHLCRMDFTGGSLWLRDQDFTVGRKTRLRIYARDVSLALKEHADSSILNRLPVKIERIELDQDPAMSLVHLRCKEQLIIARLTRRSVEHLSLQPGLSLWAQIKSVALID